MNKNLIYSQIMESENGFGIISIENCPCNAKMILRYVDIFGTPGCSIIRRLVLQYTWFEIQRTTTQ